ncbi:preprotein translocase subunit SecE [Planctomicrobium sp. SH527]|uniref:preprotein translocase subunit SecE n=1 Tax=Planctomicrobium sp. SH527 TaxID=3448123 RepID=UPI003F5C2C65
MAKAKAETSFLATLFQAKIFKGSQGRIVRQIIFLAIAGIFIITAWRLNATIFADSVNWIRVGIPAFIAVAGIWLSFALVNWPPFANFLISVEAEMDKVSWATWDYLKRATAVVLVTMTGFGAYLFLCDIVWQQLFMMIGFLQK